DHFYSTYGPKVAHFGTQGYVEQPPQGLVYSVQEPDTVPFFCCGVNIGSKISHFYTANAKEFQEQVAAGCSVDPEPGIAAGVGYLYTTPQCSAILLYRMFGPSRFDRFYTINDAERQSLVASGLDQDQGIAGYVLPNP
ncbi:hypothetical protein AN958_00139, partial [Leucoagaricus sp. SymC.cos]